MSIDYEGRGAPLYDEGIRSGTSAIQSVWLVPEFEPSRWQLYRHIPDRETQGGVRSEDFGRLYGKEWLQYWHNIDHIIW